MGGAIDTSQTTIPNCALVQLTWTDGVRGYTNNFHGAYTGVSPIPIALPETLFSAFKTAFTSSAFQAQTNVSVSFTGVQVKDLRTPNNAFVRSTGAAVLGTGVNPPLPSSTAIVVTEATAKSGKGFRGRVYLGGLAEIAQADAKHHTGAAGTAAAAFVNQIDSSMGTNGMPMCVAQRRLLSWVDKNGVTHPPREAVCVDVTSAVITNARFDTQRKRLGK
jgi:hypothetical protein